MSIISSCLPLESRSIARRLACLSSIGCYHIFSLRVFITFTLIVTACLTSIHFQSVEQENVSRGLDSEAGPSETRAPNLAEVEEVGTLASSNGR